MALRKARPKQFSPFGVTDAIAIAALSGGGGNIIDDGRHLELFWRAGKRGVAKDADREHVVAVLDEARRAGITKVGLNTEKR